MAIKYPKIRKVEERLYVLDMYELIQLQNDFDSLSLADIANLRSAMKQKNVSERSRATYEKKLHEREMAIAFENVRPMACLAKELMNQLDGSDSVIKLATFSTDYLFYMEQYLKIRYN